jgi:hypothetical protein
MPPTIRFRDIAFGIPTPPDGVPRTGVVTYSGFLQGMSEETFIYGGAWCCDLVAGGVKGAVSLRSTLGAGRRRSRWRRRWNSTRTMHWQ